MVFLRFGQAPLRVAISRPHRAVPGSQVVSTHSHRTTIQQSTTVIPAGRSSSARRRRSVRRDFRSLHRWFSATSRILIDLSFTKYADRDLW